MAHKWNMTYIRSLSELYALSSCSRWQWDNLVNIVDNIISPLLCPIYLISATLLFNFLPEVKLLSSIPPRTVTIPQLPSAFATFHNTTQLN